jgi:transposase-like protein
MDCPRCGATDVIAIKNRVDEIEVDFFHCHRCEERWWDKSGEHVSLKDILDLARKSKT